jgi:hypothetical protein
MRINLFLLLLVLTFCDSSLFSERAEESILPFDKRISDLTKEDKNPFELNLFYRGTESDYVVFYDLDGIEAYFKYRRDKFDIIAEEKLVGLFQGHSYKVRGKFHGIFSYFNREKKQVLNPPEFISLKMIKEMEERELALKKERELNAKRDFKINENQKEKPEKKYIEQLLSTKNNKPVFLLLSFESLIPDQIIR